MPKEEVTKKDVTEIKNNSTNTYPRQHLLETADKLLINEVIDQSFLI